MTSLAVRPARPVHRWVYLLAAVAGVVVLVEHARTHLLADTYSRAGMADMPEMHATTASLPSQWVWFVLMSAAMMFPLVAIEADLIAADSLWARRHIAVVEYLFGYLAVWSVFGLAAVALIAATWPAGVPAAAVVTALMVAAGWQISSIRKRALRRCGKPAYCHVRGWRANADCTAAGAGYGRRCLITCAPVMAVMALAHSALLMLALTALIFSERWRGPNPAQRAGRPFEAVCLALIAVALGVWVGFFGGQPHSLP